MPQQFLILSEPTITTLFNSQHFITKFKQLQSQSYPTPPAPIPTPIEQQSSTYTSTYTCTQNLNIGRNNKFVDLDTVVGEVSQLLLDNFREVMYRETNFLYQNRICLGGITEEIQAIKESINKMGQATSFVISGKTLTTHQSIIPQPKPTPKKSPNSNSNSNPNPNPSSTIPKPQTQSSLFLNEDEQSSIDMGLGHSRKNLTEDRLGGFSFMNSFLNQNRITGHEEDIINQRINASISKVESSIDDRITQLEKEFTRRIQQVMKTIGHLLQMMSENQSGSDNSPFKKSLTKQKIKNSLISPMDPKPKKPEQPQKILNSKSTIILPNSKKPQRLSTDTNNPNQPHNQPGPNKPQPQPQLQKQSQKSTNILTSFFGLSRLNLRKNQEFNGN